MAITVAAATVLVATMFVSAVKDQQTAQASGAMSEVAQLERDWAAAVSRGDAEALIQMLADDVRLVEPEGIVTKTDAAAGFRKRFASSNCKEVIDRVDVHVSGDTAVATGEYSGVCVNAGKEEKINTTTFGDVAVKRNGRWQFLLMTNTPKKQPGNGEGDLNVAGYQLLGAGKHQDAIAVFKTVVQIFPQSWNAYDSLGEAYAAAGKRIWLSRVTRSPSS
jgi:uncharacterized protein (TIGR02246 family)